MRHKMEATGDEHMSEERRNLYKKIQDKNLDFEDFTRDTTQTKKDLRDEMATLEDKLWRLRDQKNEIDIQNRKLEMINMHILGDSETSMRKAKEQAESQAVRAVNTDLKNHIARLQQSMPRSGAGSGEARGLMKQLNEKYEKATDRFGEYLSEAEQSRDRVAQELRDM